MSKLKLVVLLCAAVAVPARGVSAQSCLGLPSFVAGSVHLNAAGEFPQDAKTYAVGIGAGRPNNLFGNLGAGQVAYDLFSEKATYGFLEFGYQIPISMAQLCPIAGGSYSIGPDDEAAGIKVKAPGATAGLALGLPISFGVFQLIPNAGVRYEYAAVTTEEAGASIKETFGNGVVDVGLGFVIFDRISIQPIARIRFGGDSNDRTLGVFAAFSFPWRADDF
ncbi:MAG: hypothetical protein ACRENP_17590 [Longimicrobiales bacterium]